MHTNADSSGVQMMNGTKQDCKIDGGAAELASVLQAASSAFAPIGRRDARVSSAARKERSETGRDRSVPRNAVGAARSPL